jgi:hypothetical protein
MDDTRPDKLNWRKERTREKWNAIKVCSTQVFFLEVGDEVRERGKLRRRRKRKNKNKKKTSQGRTHLWRFP